LQQKLKIAAFWLRSCPPCRPQLLQRADSSIRSQQFTNLYQRYNCASKQSWIFWGEHGPFGPSQSGLRPCFH